MNQVKSMSIATVRLVDVKATVLCRCFSSCLLLGEKRRQTGVRKETVTLFFRINVQIEKFQIIG
ncbi:MULTISPECIES: hypothetical protein [Parageobacillus]|uniref:hypothetical protein n=1 Tax=Parageobacillus TaxID=1906945 RepID=UPI001E3B9789|nr:MULTISPECIES: hypothetical protein [Parageobacillus]